MMTTAVTEGIRKIVDCEVCGSTNLTLALDLGMHAICDDLVPVGDSRICREYPIEILFCETCLTAHQRFQLRKEEIFPASYHYRSRFTADVLNGMQRLVSSCGEQFGALAGKTVLDVGCNDGSLLDFFRERGAITIGIEPTDACEDAGQKGHITYQSYLGEDLAQEIASAHGPPDFITFTNVFAHIEDLRGVIASLKRLVGKKTIVVIENHYLGSVLDGNQFDTFYHEHCRTYSYTSFSYVARSLGLSLLKVEFPSRYGGNIRVFLGNVDGEDKISDVAELQKKESKFGERFAQLRDNISLWRKTKRNFIREQVKLLGKLRAKAFPARAAILIKLLGLDEDSLAAVHEKPGNLKIGHYAPGTRIPIVSDDELFALPASPAPLLNLAWHIPREIRNYLAEHGYKGPVVDIVEAGDFSARS